MQHVTIYREPGRYAGWPANYGIWSWGDEIVVGFTVGYHNSEGGFHTRDRGRPFATMQARSVDGGATWRVDPTPCRVPGTKGLSADEHVDAHLQIGDPAVGEHTPAECPGAIDMAHPDFAMMCGRTGLAAGAASWFYLSHDRCNTWQGPFQLPMFDQPGLAARTDYLVSAYNACMLFLTAAKSNGDEGRVFCARTTDGGRTFAFVSWIGDEPAGYTIMPSSVRLESGRILVAVRAQEGTQSRIDLYSSEDRGETWQPAGTPVENTGHGGNPPAMIRLRDGRLCLTYGYRDAPFGIRATLSEDCGRTWTNQIVLRDDGGCHDLGYPRTVRQAGGKVVTVYYFNDDPDGERYVAATVWSP